MNLIRFLKKSCSRLHRPVSREAGLTLTEIMIVMVIIALFTAGAIFGGQALIERQRRNTTKDVMVAVQNALRLWQDDDLGRCPESLEALQAKKYLTQAPLDGWKQPLRFKCPGDHDNEIDLVSNGKDGKENTADDIHNWDK